MHLSLSLALGSARGAAGISAPSDLSGLRAWFRGDVTVVTGSGVSQWTDQTVNAKHVTQATDASRPPLVNPDARFGNRAAVAFDGTGDFLQAAAATDWKFLHDGTGCSILVVFHVTAGTGTVTLIDTLNGTGANVGAEVQVDSTNQKVSVLFANGGANIISQSSANSSALNAVSHVFTMAYGEGASPNEYEIRLDRAAVVAGNSLAAPSASDPFGALTIGKLHTGGARMRGPIAEVALFNRRLTTAELQQLENYCASYYGI